MSHLIIYIRENERIDYYLELNSQIQSETNVEWQALPQAKQVPCTIVVPGETVGIQQISIPETSRSKLAKIVPYALEDQLIENPEDLHFSFDKFNEQGLLTVAFVKKLWMQIWLDLIRASNLNVSSIVPDYLMLPYEANSWTIYLMPKTALFRTSAALGFTVDIEKLVFVLQMKLQEAFVRPNMLYLSYCPEQSDYDKTALEALNIPIVSTPEPIETFNLFDLRYAQASTINLLDGDRVLGSKNVKTKILWKIARYLAFFCAAFWGATSLAQYIYLSHQLTELEKQTTVLYSQIFPNATTQVEPEIRIQRLIAQLKNSQTGGTFLSLLAIAGQEVVKQNGKISFSELQFNSNYLVLVVESSSFQDLESYNKQLKKYGISVEQSNARSTDKGVNARLTLSIDRSH